VSWQRTNVQAAAAYVREKIAAGDTSARAKSVLDGLLEVLDPSRRTARVQREAAEAAKASAVVQATRERRGSLDRRQRERRKSSQPPPDGIERRTGRDRRSGLDRRKRQ
jgi:hypothetical protein